MATSNTAERSVSNYTGAYNIEDYTLVAKAISGTVAMAANINARVCTSQRLRLYRNAGTMTRTDKRFWAGKSVPDRKLAGRLKSWRGSKAAEYAEENDGVEEIKEHPVLELLNGPDPHTRGSAWFHNFYFFRQTAGRVYVWMGDVSLGVPVSAFMLYPQYVRIAYDTRGLIAAYWYGRSTVNQVRYAVEEVDYYRERPNAINPLGAGSWLQSVLPETDLESAALQAEIARWGNGSFPGLILEANEKTSDIQMRQMQADLTGLAQGVSKTGSPIILRNTKATPFGHKPNEMGYVPGQERCEKRIYDAAGIPESIYRLNSANLASAEVGNGQYMRATIRPMVNAAADELTQLMLPRFGLEPGVYFFAYDDPVGEDVDATADRMLAGLSAGAVTINEYRKVMGLDPVEDGDDLRAPPSPFPGMTFGQGASNETEEGDEAGGEDAEGDDAAEPVDGGESSKGLGERARGLPGKSGCGADCGGACGCGKDVGANAARHAELRRKAWQVIARRKAAGVPLDPATGLPKSMLAEVDALAGGMEKWYDGAYKELAGTIDPLGNVGRLSSDTLGKLDSVLTDGLIRILNEAAKVAVVQVNGDPEAFKLKPDTAMAYAKARGGELIVTVPETMRSVVGEQVSIGLGANETVDEIRDRIAKGSPELAGWQAERIARTESSVAYQEGKLASWGQLGVEKKQWITSGAPCQVCEQWAADNPEPIPTNQAFKSQGQSMMIAQAHPNDQCDVVPVLAGDEEEVDSLVRVTGPLEAV